MTVTSSSGVRFLNDGLEHWAGHSPDALALDFEGRRWTWAQWRERVHRVTGALASAGIRRGDRVAFLDKNNPACLEVTLGVAALGASNAVVNWRLAGEELDYVINDSGARVLFVGAELMPTIERIRGSLTSVERVVVVGGDADEYEAWLEAAEPLGVQSNVTEDDTCLVMYSSGTTGRPKGVMLTHRNVVAHTIAVAPLFPFDSGDANLVAMPLFHVGGTCYALIGIHVGVPTIMTREPDGASLLGALDRGATHAFLVPAVVAGIMAAGDAAIAAFSRLKYLGYGASPMPLPVLRAGLDAWPETRFTQVYGMTELAGVISALSPEAHRDQSRPERLGSAGTIVTGAEMRIVDPVTGEDVERGEIGELWFRSDQRTPGYLNKPDATAETIVDGWLRSGDLGRVDDGGFVFIEDRVKDMIITGGENVYSPEVERVLIEHPSVGEVAVIGVPDDYWGESIKAVVTPAHGQTTVAADEIIEFARQRLAHYKCPRTVDVVQEMPRNPTGKILKRTLRKPHWEGRQRQV